MTTTNAFTWAISDDTGSRPVGSPETRRLADMREQYGRAFAYTLAGELADHVKMIEPSAAQLVFGWHDSHPGQETPEIDVTLFMIRDGGGNVLWADRFAKPFFTEAAAWLASHPDSPMLGAERYPLEEALEQICCVHPNMFTPEPEEGMTEDGHDAPYRWLCLNFAEAKSQWDGGPDVRGWASRTAALPDSPARQAFAGLNPGQRDELLMGVFKAREYNVHGEPGGDWSSDTLQDIGQAFNAFGVTFTAAA